MSQQSPLLQKQAEGPRKRVVQPFIVPAKRLPTDKVRDARKTPRREGILHDPAAPVRFPPHQQTVVGKSNLLMQRRKAFIKPFRQMGGIDRGQCMAQFVGQRSFSTGKVQHQPTLTALEIAVIGDGVVTIELLRQITVERLIRAEQQHQRLFGLAIKVGPPERLGQRLDRLGMQLGQLGGGQVTLDDERCSDQRRRRDSPHPVRNLHRDRVTLLVERLAGTRVRRIVCD